MSNWGQWAEEAEMIRNENRWAYLYSLSYKRAEMFLELLGDRVSQCASQAEMLHALEEKLHEVRRENSELSEALESAENQLEELEAEQWGRRVG